MSSLKNTINILVKNLDELAEENKALRRQLGIINKALLGFLIGLSITLIVSIILAYK